MEKANAIPKDVALRLRAEIREENRDKWHTLNGLWCWGYHKFTKGNPTKLCFAAAPGNRGCSQVNRRYAQRLHITA